MRKNICTSVITLSGNRGKHFYGTSTATTALNAGVLVPTANQLHYHTVEGSKSPLYIYIYIHLGLKIDRNY